MDIILLLAGLVFVGIAVTLVAQAVLTPSARSTERIDQIGAYGFSGTIVGQSPDAAGDNRLSRLVDRLAGWLGSTFGRRLSTMRERELRQRLVSAGMYSVSARKVFGYQFLLAALGGIVWFWLAGLAGANPILILLGTIVCIAAGWVLPLAYVDNRRRQRRDRIERELPDLIDLLVVTIEAGLSFNQGLRTAGERMHGPLAQELRLTLQEQNMGLTLTEGLRNLLGRADTTGVRAFVRAIAQGEELGVSTGTIMRNLADEMRKRRKAAAEEQAQKAPVKMLFPLIFLIFPAIFTVLLLPALMRIGDVLG
jgi:tight adherence protein C